MARASSDKGNLPIPSCSSHDSLYHRVYTLFCSHSISLLRYSSLVVLVKRTDGWGFRLLTMPGYRLAGVDKINLPDKFFCSLCSELLRDAVQTNCGHLYCESCLEQLSKWVFDIWTWMNIVFMHLPRILDFFFSFLKRSHCLRPNSLWAKDRNEIKSTRSELFKAI